MRGPFCCVKKCQKNKKTRFALLLKPSLTQKLMKNSINDAESGFEILIRKQIIFENFRKIKLLIEKISISLIFSITFLLFQSFFSDIFFLIAQLLIKFSSGVF